MSFKLRRSIDQPSVYIFNSCTSLIASKYDSHERLSSTQDWVLACDIYLAYSWPHIPIPECRSMLKWKNKKKFIVDITRFIVLCVLMLLTLIVDDHNEWSNRKFIVTCVCIIASIFISSYIEKAVSECSHLMWFCIVELFLIALKLVRWIR